MDGVLCVSGRVSGQYGGSLWRAYCKASCSVVGDLGGLGSYGVGLSMVSLLRWLVFHIHEVFAVVVIGSAISSQVIAFVGADGCCSVNV